MAIEQISGAAFDYDEMKAEIQGTYVGKADITISEFDSTAAPDVKVGSKFEVSGALFKVLTADETPTGYAGISSSTTFYLVYDSSGEAFVYTEVAPTWNDALQGWYGTGGEANDRYFFSMYKDSGDTLYENKSFLGSINRVLTKVIAIGDWDMSAATGTSFVTITSGLAQEKVLNVSVMIIQDGSTNIRPLDVGKTATDTERQGFVEVITDDSINLLRLTGGTFDGALYNATSFNRGWVTITYVV